MDHTYVIHGLYIRAMKVQFNCEGGCFMKKRMDVYVINGPKDCHGMIGNVFRKDVYMYLVKPISVIYSLFLQNACCLQGKFKSIY